MEILALIPPPGNGIPFEWRIQILIFDDQIRLFSHTNKKIAKDAYDILIEGLKDIPFDVCCNGNGLQFDCLMPFQGINNENELVTRLNAIYDFLVELWKLAAEASGYEVKEDFSFNTKTVTECLDKCDFIGTKGSYKTDSDGDILLSFSKDTHVPAADWFIWIYVKDRRLKFDSGLRNVSAETTADAADLCEKLEGVTVDRQEGRTARIKFHIDSDVVPDTASLVKRLTKVYEFYRDIWSKVPAKLTIDTATVKTCLDQCSFMRGNVRYEADSDGDIRIDVEPSGSNPVKWFVWCYISSDKIVFDTGSSNIPAEYEMSVARGFESADNVTVECNESRGMRIKVRYNANDLRDMDNLKDLIQKQLSGFDGIWASVGKGYFEEERRKTEQKRHQEEQRRKEEERNAARIDPFTLSIDDNDEIRTAMKKFNSELPYLRLGFYMVQTGKSADKTGESISAYDRDTLFKKIHSYKGGSYDIDIDSKTTPASLEKIFRKETGLVIKVCYTDDEDERYYISKDAQYYNMPLGKINSIFEDKGYYHHDWY